MLSLHAFRYVVANITIIGRKIQILIIKINDALTEAVIATTEERRSETDRLIANVWQADNPLDVGGTQKS